MQSLRFDIDDDVDNLTSEKQYHFPEVFFSDLKDAVDLLAPLTLLK